VYLDLSARPRHSHKMDLLQQTCRNLASASQYDPTLVGQTSLSLELSESSYSTEQTFVGFEALRRSTLLSLKYPMEHGIVWTGMNRQAHRSRVRDCMKWVQFTYKWPVMTVPLNPKRHRERLTTCFRQFSVPDSKFQWTLSTHSTVRHYTDWCWNAVRVSPLRAIVDGYVMSTDTETWRGGRDVNE